MHFLRMVLRELEGIREVPNGEAVSGGPGENSQESLKSQV